MQRCLIAATLLLAMGAIATAPAPARTESGQREAPAFTPVTPERLLNAEDEPHNGLMYSGNYKAQRYTRLDGIDRQNVAGLEIAWVCQLDVGRANRSTTARILNRGSA